MSLKYLNLSGLEDLWINIKNYILSKVPTKTSELTNDSGYLTSHQSLSNYVTLNTAQEITSAKTFKNTTTRKLTSVEAGNVIPTSDKFISDIWQDKNGKELGRIHYTKTSGGNTALIMRAGDWFTSNEEVYTLDASGTNRRAELHLYTDSSGNCCIKPVGYFSATLKPLSSSVWLGEYGKPFGVAYVNQVRFTNATLQVDVDIDATEEHSIGFFGKNNSPLSYITFQKRPSFKDRVAIRIQTTSSTYKSYCFDANCLYPEVDNSLNIGSSSKIFKNIYCNNYYKGTTAFGDIVTHNASEFLTSHQSLANYALDANVVHTSGNETVAGFKQFATIRVTNSIKAINLENTTTDLNSCYSNFASSNEGRGGNIQYYYCNTDAGIVNISNLPEAKAFFLTSITTRLLSNSLYVKQVLINSNSKTFVRYCNNSTWSSWVNETDSEYVHKSGDETINGNKTFSSINGVEPSSLSLPSGNVSDFIDISSYFSNTESGGTNSYTASANGWIYLKLGDITSCQVVLNDSRGRRLWGTSATGNIEQIIMPILKNTTLTTTWVTNSTVNVATARFIPCHGNV